MFHVGGARSALYNWATARQRGGTFVLRIEDTDAARNKPEWTAGIVSALASIGIHEGDPAFEGPSFQSAAVERHRSAAEKLYAAGRAYYCDCTRERLAERTGSAQLGYDGFCRWAHLPVIVNEKRQKLSKRRDKVALEDYLTEGYLPEAMVNYLILLGWGPKDDVEIRPYAELEQLFRVEDVNAASAYFDVAKLRAFNGEYLRAMGVAEFTAACGPWLAAPRAPWPADAFDARAFAALAPLAQSRIAVLGEIVEQVDFLFLSEPVRAEPSWAKAMKGRGSSLALLRTARERLAAVAAWEAAALKEELAAVAAEHGLKLGKAQAPVRVAVTGRTVGLPLFESLEVLGRERTLARLDAAVERLA
ncbi:MULTISPECIES: glutamate--tRNA ligase family protein [unclassified Kitasatospora]|uniref:glutamate--tRNA ligase n=1 Tax=unclassified Kitasatospora TaxID=2633591 RepID=UPI0033D75CC4